MLNRFADWVVKLRWPIIVVFIVITSVFASQIPNATIESDVKKMLPEDLPARINLTRIEEIFGGTDMIMLVMSADDVLATDTLRRTRKLSKKLERVKGVDRVLSLFTLKDIRSENEQLIVDPAVKRIPKTDAKREKLRAALRDNELVYGNVVSKDFKATTIIGLLDADADDNESVALVEKLIAEVPGPEEVLIAGMPFIRKNVGEDIPADMRKFLPFGMLLMLIFLFLCFKQLRGVLLPFVVVVMSILFSMGLIPLLGWKIQMITVLLPVILIAVANDYGIHILARYQEDNLPGAEITKQDLARLVIRDLFSPVVVTGVTTIAGLMCLMTHIVLPAKQLGILASAGVAFALMGSLMFIPAILALLPKSKPVLGVATKSGKRRPLERILHISAQWVTRRPSAITIGTLLITLGVATGIRNLIVDTDPIHYYEDEAPVARSAKLVDEHFGGNGAISIVAQGDIKDPTVLKHIDDLEKKITSLPEVGQSTSIAQIMRRINRVWNENDHKFDRIPDTREAVAQFFELYMMSGDPEDFERQVDFEFKHAVVTARLNTLSTGAIDKVMDFANREVAKKPEGMFPIVGGFIGVLAAMSYAIVNGQVLSLSLSLVLVSILVMMLFRSVVAGLLSIVPLGLAMALLFGLMGYLGMELNIATALLSSIMIGVAIDYTIHFLWRYRAERQAGKAPDEAVHITLTTTGRGIIFNALSVIIGFAVVLLSSFQPVQFFGFLVVVSIGTCLYGALWMLPAICLLVRPKFLEPKQVAAGGKS